MCVLMCVLVVAPFVAFPQTVLKYVSTLSSIESTLTLRYSMVVLVATRSSESDGRSEFTDSLDLLLVYIGLDCPDCPDLFRLP